VRLSLDGVGHRYGGDGRGLDVLADIDLTVEPGEFVCLLGPSGCGKTTLLRIIAGLLEPSAGSVGVGELTPAAARRAKLFGLVPQTPALLPWRSVAANVGLLHRVNRRARTVEAPDVTRLLGSFGLEAFGDALPRELSGGMQQRASLARAFGLGAPVMLLDEPFSALDELTRADMQALLLELWERTGTTVVFVTHSVPEAVTLADRIVVMSRRPGRIAAIHRVEVERPRSDGDDAVEHIRHVRAQLREAAG
jgi:NitT/TauT family transport system ATP-binding protein